MADLQTLNHYQISQNPDGSALELARNHSEVVCLGYDTRNDHFVSFHVIIPEISGRKEFARRAAIARLLDHPSLARLLDYGEEEDSFYYVTELVDGESLAAYLDRVDSIPKYLAADLAARMVAAILALRDYPELLPATSTSSFRVFQDTPCSIRVILSEFLLHSTIGHPPKSIHLTRTNLQKNSQFLTEMLRSSGRSKKGSYVDASEFKVLLDELLCEDFSQVLSELEDLELELKALVPEEDKPAVDSNIRPVAVLSREMPDAEELEGTLGPSYLLHEADEVAGRYAWETQDPGFGRVIAQALPPARLCSAGGRLAVKRAVTNVNSRDHPHLLRALALWEGDFPCYIEEPVDSFSLRELCASREPFEPDELFILLQKLDVALVEAEAAEVSRRELIPGDAFIVFFGSKKDRSLEDLAEIGLDRWPDFQIKLRAHPSGEALAGRRTGMPSRGSESVQLGKLDTRSFVELAFGLLGLPRNPSAEVLAERGLPPRLVRLVQNYWLNEADRSNLDRERFLRAFGAAIAPGQVADEVHQSSRSMGQNGHSSAIAEAEDDEPIGLAEALFGGRGIGAPSEGGLPPQNPDSIDPSYLSGPGLPFLFKLVGVLILSAALAAAISHVGGGAFWLEERPQIEPIKSTDPADPINPTVPQDPGGLPAPTPLDVTGGPTPGPGSEIPIPLPNPINPDDDPDPDPGIAVLPPVPVDPVPPDRPIKPDRPGPPANLEEALAHYLDLQRKSGGSPSSPPSEELRSLLEEIKNTPDLVTSEMEDDLRSAAEWGSPEAMVALARRYLQARPGQAFAWFQAAAEIGNGEAHVELGKLYLTGKGTEKDPAAGVRHFIAAADLEEPSAFFPLANCYLDGIGVPQDARAATTYLAKGVEIGDPKAMNALGECCEEGIGVARDFSRAAELYSEAYQRGNLDACRNLGELLIRGQGITADPARAASLFKEGAAKGMADCMYLYAQCLNIGSGVAEDKDAAIEWYRRSAREGYEKAIQWCRLRRIEP